MDLLRIKILDQIKSNLSLPLICYILIDVFNVCAWLWWRHQMETFSTLLVLCDGHRQIPLTKASDAEFRCYLWSVPEETIDQTIETPLIREAIVLIMTSLWCCVWHEFGTVAQHPKEYAQNGVLCFVVLIPSVISECKWSIYSYSSRLLEPALTLYLLQWRHNERDGVSNHQCLESLRNRLFRRRFKKKSKLRVTGLCEVNPPVMAVWIPLTKDQ